MNKLIKGLEQIMDLDDGEVLRSEVSRKLHNTILVINGVLTYTAEFIFEDGVILGYDLKGLKAVKSSKIRVNTIEVFIPESGLYTTVDGAYLFITKVPKKQWYKSFHDSAYSVIRISSLTRREHGDWREVLGVKSREKKNIILTKNGNIFYHDIFIGTTLGDKLICNSSLYKQELTDWVRDARE